MIAVSDRLFASVIGPNWYSHYRNAFSKIETGDRPTLQTWNSAAALVPFWFVYRGLTVWAFIFFLGSLLLYVVFSTLFALFPWMHSALFLLPFVPAYVVTSILQGAVADVLVRRNATRKVNEVRRTATDEADAIRRLAAFAPSSGYAAHGTKTLLGLPLWAVAVVVCTRALTPAYDESRSVYVTLMRNALRELSVMQENFFLDRARYSADAEELGYTPPEGVSVRLTSGSDSGWSGTAMHPMVGWPCTIFVGRTGQEEAAGQEGVPNCPDPGA